MHRLLRCLVAFVVAVSVVAGCARHQVFTTGNEQTIIGIASAFSRHPRVRGGPFRNSVDHALAILEARAYPPPDRRTLAAGATRSLCTEYHRQTQKEVPAQAVQAWHERLGKAPAFEAVLGELDAAAGQPLDRTRLVRAGLEGALQASGCRHACVLTPAQTAEIEAMMKARAHPGTSDDGAAELIRADQPEPGILRLVIRSFEGSGIARRVAELLRIGMAAGATTVILDVRDNPGGRPEEANGVSDIFLERQVLQVVVFADGRRLAFRSKPGAIGLPLIVLTNGNTGSSAEMLTMALQDHYRATIVGETTAGALFGKDVQKLTGGEMIVFRTEPTVLSPNGTDYTERGISPDVVVADTRRGVKDAILQRAIDLAKQTDSDQGQQHAAGP